MQQIAEQFTNFYYQTFDTQKDRSGLAPLYRENSMLTWEGEAILGVQNIINKLNGLPFEKVAHKILTADPQPSSNNSANLLVLVTGQLIVDDSPAPMPYSQMFQLVQDGNGYYVQNDVFRLVYG